MFCLVDILYVHGWPSHFSLRWFYNANYIYILPNVYHPTTQYIAGHLHVPFLCLVHTNGQFCGTIQPWALISSSTSIPLGCNFPGTARLGFLFDAPRIQFAFANPEPEGRKEESCRTNNCAHFNPFSRHR